MVMVVVYTWVWVTQVLTVGEERFGYSAGVVNTWGVSTWKCWIPDGTSSWRVTRIAVPGYCLLQTKF